MAKVIAPLTKFAITVGASALGAGPLSTLPQEFVIPLLKSLLGDGVTGKLAELGDDVIGNLAGDFAKEIIDSIKRDPPQELQRLYLLALRQSLIDEREKLRREIGEPVLFTGQRQLPDDHEKLFTVWLTRIESVLGDKIDLEMLFGEPPALETILETGEASAGWGFLKRNLAAWAEPGVIPADLADRLRQDLPGILADNFSSLLSSPTYQRAFNKHQAHFQHLLNQSLLELRQVADRMLQGVEGLHQKSDRILDDLQALLARAATTPANPAHAVKEPDYAEFHKARIREWSQPRYQLDKRFVNLTLLLDKGENEPQRWQKAPDTEDYRFNDLRDVLKMTEEYPALVLLGAPGSGKSTLLRRLQFDYGIDRLCDGAEQISFFIQLNGYGPGSPEPREWLNSRWKERYPELPPLEAFLREGRTLLLLDALNEMRHRSVADYFELVGKWREFTRDVAAQANRIVFSCRSLDYSAQVSSDELRVPQVEAQPMNRDQMRAFLRSYAPDHEERIWGELDSSPQFGLFQTPYFLDLLCKQVVATGELPKGRAALFTGFVRQALDRQCKRDDALFLPDTLLDEKDRLKLTRRAWADEFDLPERGALIPRLSSLAFGMQESEFKTESKEVLTGYDSACGLIAHDRARDIIKAGLALNVLDEDEALHQIKFFHQLLQEYFAARRLAKNPDPTLVHVEWEAEKVSEALEETLVKLADGDPLPPLPQTGWEETTLTAAPMAKDPQAFIRDLIPRNLPLAARCAASPELKVNDELKREIQQALVARTQEMKADLRARIAAGEALGLIGDPRFELRTGPHGDYLLPPLVEIPGGTYPMGTNDSEYDDEKPAHTVEHAPFQIGQFPVTNAEYKLFIEAGGYEDEQWWDTEESLAWLRGEASAEGAKAGWRDTRKSLQNWSDDELRDLVTQNRITSKQAEDYVTIRNWADEEFERWLEEQYPAGKLYRQPEFWDDTRFNNPSQPVVGVTWVEARAYCNWLTANVYGSVPRPVGSVATGAGQSPAATLPTGRGTDLMFRLPTEAEFEAAARGKKGRLYPYSKTFDASKCNTFESHIRRTTPVGIFDNATPEEAFDLSGNAYTWTLSIHDQDQFPYPYRSDDGREDIQKSGVYRILRGGAWVDFHFFARAVVRDLDSPLDRDGRVGFRVGWCVRPPSLTL